eukprot:12405087-Karenia_brevis.AAC.2
MSGVSVKQILLDLEAWATDMTNCLQDHPEVLDPEHHEPVSHFLFATPALKNYIRLHAGLTGLPQSLCPLIAVSDSSCNFLEVGASDGQRANTTRAAGGMGLARFINVFVQTCRVSGLCLDGTFLV